jgi:ferredoxin
MTRKIIPIVSAGSQEAGLYEATKKIYPRTVRGMFARWRWAMVFLTQLVFYGLPWLEWGGRQMVLFDLAARRFYIFGLVLYPQDLIYLTGLLVVSALRCSSSPRWPDGCGAALPARRRCTPRSSCGSSARSKATAARACGLTPNLVAREAGEEVVQALRVDRHRDVDRLHLRGLLHAGARTGHGLPADADGFVGSVLGFLLRLRHLRQRRLHARAGLQVHVPLRALPERHVRPRHAHRQLRHRNAASRAAPRRKGPDPRTLGLGDCIDCGLCVQVCPTGIDIREGLQYECIGCGLRRCLRRRHGQDGLPAAADPLHTQNGMEAGWSRRQLLRRVLRPRVLVYTAALRCWWRGCWAAWWLRTPLKVDVVRDRASLARIAEGGRLENVYRLQIMNATEKPQHYRISADGLDGLSVSPDEPVTVDAAQSRWVAVRLQVPYGAVPAGSHTVHFGIREEGSGAQVSEKAAFLVPR